MPHLAGDGFVELRQDGQRLAAVGGVLACPQPGHIGLAGALVIVLLAVPVILLQGGQAGGGRIVGYISPLAIGRQMIGGFDGVSRHDGGPFVRRWKPGGCSRSGAPAGASGEGGDHAPGRMSSGTEPGCPRSQGAGPASPSLTADSSAVPSSSPPSEVSSADSPSSGSMAE